MSRSRTRAVEQSRLPLLFVLAAFALLAAFIVGTVAVVAQDAEEPAASAAAEEPAAEGEAEAASGIDGTWLVDTEIGSFEGSEELAAFSSSWVGFRIAEVLNNIGETEAVGRTPLVAGELVVDGSTIESATIQADLTDIRSDQSRRDPAIQRALGTADFPTATFVSSGPVDLGEVPTDGVPFSASVPGTLTIRDVSQDVTLDMDGQRVGDTVVVVGTLPVDFTSFDVSMPTAPIVVSVEDSGDLEWQLFLSRQP